MKVNDFNARVKIFGGFGTLIFVAVIITIVAWNAFWQSNKLGNSVIALQNVQSRFQLTRYNVRMFQQSKDEQYINAANHILDSCISVAEVLRDSKLNSASGSINDFIDCLKKYKTALRINAENIKEQKQLRQDLLTQGSQIKSELESTRTGKDVSVAFNNMYIGYFEFRINPSETSGSKVLDNCNNLIDFSQKQHLELLGTSFKEYQDNFKKLQEITQMLEVTNTDQLKAEVTASSLAEKAIAEVKNMIQSKMKGSSILMALLIIVLIVFGIADGLFVSDYYVKQLGKSVELATAYSEGNFNYSLSQEDLELRDEVGNLTRALNAMGEKLRIITETVQQQAIEIANAGQGISATSVQLSSGANQQASSVEEISSSMEEMVSNTEQNTKNAEETEKISNQASLLIEQVSEASEKSLESVRVITERIGIINDIAFQTNLLALNAAVEAARAGDHGRGFAVVASEVRKLAENSKKAADEVIVMAHDSKQLTDHTVELMKKMQPEITKTTRLIHEIAGSSREQLNGADQINNAIQQLNLLTQGTAAAAEELSAGAGELNTQSENLLETMSFFRFNNDFDQNEPKKTEKPKQKTISPLKFKISDKEVRKMDAETNKLKNADQSGVDIIMSSIDESLGNKFKKY